MFNTLTAIRSAGGGSALTPPITANLLNWVDASLEENVVFRTTEGDGELIDQFTDLSGNNNHWAAIVSAETPIWSANIRNGLGSIDNSTAARGKFTSSPMLSGSQEAELWIVMQKTSGSTNSGGLCQMGEGGASGFPNYFHQAGTDRNVMGWGTTDTFRAVGHTPTGVVKNGAWYVLNVRADFNDWAMLINNIVQVALISNTVAWSTSTWILGESIGPIDFIGYFGEMLIYDQVMSGADRNTTFDYFNSKWALGF